ncbi:MAG: hypothetical protein JWQ71_102 [Pedosphaera sp.]|nr:hypothetical protein [Pedosphaera sp.]
MRDEPWSTRLQPSNLPLEAVAILVGSDPDFAPKYLCEVTWTRVANIKPDVDNALRRLSQWSTSFFHAHSN